MKPCGCTLAKNKIVTQCDYHKERDVLIQNRTSLFLESRIKLLFAETHLREMEDKIRKEIKRLRK